MSNQSSKNPPSIGELEALRDVLHSDNAIDPNDIPVLQDVVKLAAGQNPAPATDTSESNTEDEYDYEHELFIQELVDDMMPMLEAQLRKKLLALDAEILQRWHQQTLNS
ncbi:MAG: hypothetical protein ACSHWQ_08640 [Spongiibacteraceae bacterium]